MNIQKSKEIVLIILILFSGWDCSAQVFLNGSFENTSATPVCHYNLSNANFNSFMPNVNAYGMGNELDIMVAGCAVPSIPNGQFCVALAHDPTDEIALALSTPLIIGNTYSFTFWAYSDTTIREQGDLEIGASTTNNNFGTLIYIANTIPATWVQYTVTFLSTTAVNFITVRNIAGDIHWNRVDDFVLSNCQINLNLSNDTTLCTGETLLLNATNSNATYQWQDSSTNPTFTVSQPGTYWVNVTTNICSATDTINVSYNPFPVISLGMDSSLCQGETLILNATTSNATYQWHDSSTNSTFTVSQPGTYWVNVTTNNCSTTDTIHVNYYPIPVISLGLDSALCQGETLMLNATTANATYQWQDNSTNPTYTVSQPGTYWINITINNCSATDTINVSYNPSPTFELGNDTSLCLNETLMLIATTSNASYLWHNNSTNSTFTVSQPGTYWVTVTTNNCTANDTININYNPSPEISLGFDSTLCQGETLMLYATLANATYQWQDNSTNSTYTVSQPGTYWVNVTVNNCSMTDSLKVEFDECEIILDMPNVFTPNNDGVNDYFHPIEIKGINDGILIISNRWGQKLIETSNILTGWDGKFNGQECTEGTYFWIVQYTTIANDSRSIKGFLTLIK